MTGAILAAVVIIAAAVLFWRGRRPPDPYAGLGAVERHRVARPDDDAQSFRE